MNQGRIYRIRITDAHEKSLLIDGRYFIVAKDELSKGTEECTGKVIYYAWTIKISILRKYLVNTSECEEQNVRKLLDRGKSDISNIMIHECKQVLTIVRDIQSKLDEFGDDLRVKDFQNFEQLRREIMASITDFADLEGGLFSELEERWGILQRHINRLGLFERKFIRGIAA